MSYESIIHIAINELRVIVEGRYEGERNNDGERHGYGTALLTSGDTYQGLYNNGKRHGYGIYRFVNKARYEGEYVNNKREGTGTMYFPDGSLYKGEWKNNKRSGNGKYKYVNGDTYEGEWKLGRRHGQGVYVYKDLGISYKGNWAFGKFDGKGQVHTPYYVYNGTFYDETSRGPGRFSFKTGCAQTGQYVSKRVVLEGYSVENRPAWISTGLHYEKS
ncbi:radial spoke head 1 homolog [Nematostella vectensis]|uniref:radial spoke head 1 homolog n=1 Tax=Nematostella vectensis TaxID=45351 RepID=UPI00207725ED|nr:radial spoke head 1 homolog [Nematostella vectensis]